MLEEVCASPQGPGPASVETTRVALKKTLLDSLGLLARQEGGTPEAPTPPERGQATLGEDLPGAL